MATKAFPIKDVVGRRFTMCIGGIVWRGTIATVTQESDELVFLADNITRLSQEREGWVPMLWIELGFSLTPNGWWHEDPDDDAIIIATGVLDEIVFIAPPA